MLQRPRSDNALNSLIYGTGNYRFDNYRSNTLMYKSKQNTLCEARESKPENVDEKLVHFNYNRSTHKFSETMTIKRKN